MEERPSSQVPPKNWAVFFLLVAAMLWGYPFLMEKFFPKKPQVVVNVKQGDVKPADKDSKVAGGPASTKSTGAAEPPKATADGVAAAKSTDRSSKPIAGADKVADDKHPDAKAGDAKPDKVADKANEPAIGPGPPANFPEEWITLGSVDPKSRYRMLVTLGNRGASLARVELSSERYRDFEDRTGYLGHLVIDSADKALVQVVGPGTPAFVAGIQPGDRIVKIGDKTILSAAGIDALLEKTKPDETIEMTIRRKDQTLTKSVKLTRRPVEVVSPEDKRLPEFRSKARSVPPIDLAKASPLSLLMTMQQIDKLALPTPDESKDSEIKIADELSNELQGVRLRDSNWELVRHDDDSAEFRAIVRSDGRDTLEIRKIYRLAKTTEATSRVVDGKFYHLQLSLEFKNIDSSKKAHDIAYRLDGPTGLPHEGAWYASKVAVKGGCGLRDVVYKMTKGSMSMTTTTQLDDKPLQTIIDGSQINETDRPAFIGVDGQYFSAVLLPKPDTTANNIDRAVALRVGDVDPERKTLTNTSFRIVGKPTSLGPDQTVTQSFEFFAGPKRPALLNEYGLNELVYYGWFGWDGLPICPIMAAILNFFYGIFHNYGLAIICLTVIVRLCMFPLSRAQAKNMQLMQKMQPEMKRINEKYSKDLEARTKATEELFRKYNTSQANQLGGCLVMFVQLPIFFGLYRSLQINVDLRDAPLFSESIRWCSNLAAPDMLYDWSAWMPAWFNAGVASGSMFALGPYFNLLPLLTVGLFLAQQKLVMPPPADEQAAMQQKMMNFMMLFMLLMFYKSASGLCIYFIASTLWGLAERQFLPKKVTADDGEQQLSTQSPYSRPTRNGDNGDELARRRKKRKK